MMEEKINTIKEGIVEAEITEKWGAGKATQMNNDADPIENIRL